MVALSFKSQFEAPILDGTKSQTVRANRKRNPRIGEALQLYVGMRTKQCRKIRADVICLAVEEIEIVTGPLDGSGLEAITLNGIPLDDLEIENFAIMDGFRRGFLYGEPYSARQAMGSFWRRTHGDGRFEGVLIRWMRFGIDLAAAPHQIGGA